MDRQPGCMRVVARYEVDVRLHQARDEIDIAGKAIELGDDQCRAPCPTKAQRRGDLRPVIPLAAFDFLELGDDPAAGAGDVPGYGFALRLEAKPRCALLVG